MEEEKVDDVMVCEEVNEMVSVQDDTQVGHVEETEVFVALMKDMCEGEALIEDMVHSG